MRIDYYIYGTLVTTATSLSAPIHDASAENAPDTVARAIDTTGPSMKREEPASNPEGMDLAKKAFIQCPELSGLPPIPCSLHICGGQSSQRPGYCNDDYPSVRHCRCMFIQPVLTLLIPVAFLVLLSDH